MPTSPARRRPLLVLAVTACLAAGLSGPIVTAATAANSAPVRIAVDSISSTIVAAPAGTPAGAIPYVLVEAGGQFSVNVSFYDELGAASFNQDTVLAISTNRGTPSPATVTVAGGLTTAALTTSLATAANEVVVTVRVAGGKAAKTVAPGVSGAGQSFDVLSEIRLEDSQLDFQQGIGGDAECTSATRDDPVCGVVILPAGARPGSKVLLSLGACDATYAKCGSNEGAVVQTLADLGTIYQKTSPATIVMKCDKFLCGGGSIRSKTLNYSLLGNAALQIAKPCPAKNTVGDDPACVDYVQSKRDGSGDTYLYLLLTRDARVSVG